MKACFGSVGIVAVLSALGCNEVPVTNLTSSYTIQIQGVREKSQPAKLDILWVVDDSPSMCQEQQSLAASFSTFLKTFRRYTAIDMKLAVTSTNVCPKDKPYVRGQFLYRPADDSTISPECVEKRVLPCLKTEDCATRPELQGLDPENWVCEPKPAQFMYSCDKPAGFGQDKYPGDLLMVVNSMCRYKCDKDVAPQACGDTFGGNETCGKACKDGVIGTEECPDGSTMDQCLRAGQTDLSCNQKCQAYLHDPGKCAQVCGSSDCYKTCVYAGDPPNFPKQDFLCTVVCDKSYQCDERCIAEFGKPTYRCLYPGGDKSHAGCLLPPATQYCPKNGPKVLTQGDPDCCIYSPDQQEFIDNCATGVEDGSETCTWFKAWKKGSWSGNPDWTGMPDADVYDKVFELLFSCMATIATGATQTPCANQEQGLQAAWMALDPAGENAAQAKAFLRPDAYLLIVVVSDEEDCSSVEKGVKAEDYGICGCLADQNGCKADGTCGHAPGPLIPPEDYVNKFKSLKADPAMVVFAAIVGDVIPGSQTSPDADPNNPDDFDKVRERYYACKCVSPPTAFSPLTYACLSPQGKADIGARYHRVARGFGPMYGQTSNICDDKGLEPAMENIANLIIPLLTNICLPRPLTEDEVLEVYKLDPVTGEMVLQQQSTPTETKDYRVASLGACGTFDDIEPGERLENSVIFEKPLEYSDRIQFVYRAKSFYGQ